VAVAARSSRRRRAAAEEEPHGRRFAVLSLTALGVVYGDIGTSPLYAFRECFKPEYGLRLDVATVYGVLSLIVWSLILIVSVKYIVFIMRLDNHGEGGILALLALVLRIRRLEGEHAVRVPVIALGLFGAALLYGDGVITPSISVLSAVEGIEIATPAFAHVVVPVTLVILVLLFRVQKYGTASVGGVFGPIMMVWFLTIAALGLVEILRTPRVLLALSPWYAVRFFLEHGTAGFFVLGAVVLAVTGAEALYADMGHFGRRPIRFVWFGAVLPALILNYFGQGALLLRMPDAVQNPFYLLAPRALLYPLVVIATLATIVASQALISGAFSLTQQCMQLRYCPRLSIVHTSRAEVGQIYMPEVSGALMIGCLLLVLGFRSSGALGAAYGIAVTGTMATTTVLFYVLARHRWRWSPLRAAGLTGLFLAVDLAFLGANALKIEHGGWVPLVIAGGIFLVMITWNQGSRLANEVLASAAVPLDRFLADVERLRPPRVSGTSVFLTADVRGAPLVLVYHFRHNKVLHEEVILLSILTEEVPEVPDDERLEVEPLPDGFHRVKASYGFMEQPDVEEILARCRALGMRAQPEGTTYYLSRLQFLPTGAGRMMRWRKRLFALMARNAVSVADFFELPPQRVVELGARIEL
jgi:KUP system potassium uptake protein